MRSLRSEETIVKVFSELLRVSERVFIAESLPIVNNECQKAHPELYNLREEIFEALFGRKDDLHYFPLEKLGELVEKAGDISSKVEPSNRLYRITSHTSRGSTLRR